MSILTIMLFMNIKPLAASTTLQTSWFLLHSRLKVTEDCSTAEKMLCVLEVWCWKCRHCVEVASAVGSVDAVRYVRRASELSEALRGPVPGLSSDCMDYIRRHPSNVYDTAVMHSFAESLCSAGQHDKAAAVYFTLLQVSFWGPSVLHGQFTKLGLDKFPKAALIAWSTMHSKAWKLKCVGCDQNFCQLESPQLSSDFHTDISTLAIWSGTRGNAFMSGCSQTCVFEAHWSLIHNRPGMIGCSRQRCSANLWVVGMSQNFRVPRKGGKNQWVAWLNCFTRAAIQLQLILWA